MKKKRRETLGGSGLFLESRHVSESCAGREKFRLSFTIKENIARLASKKD